MDPERHADQRRANLLTALDETIALLESAGARHWQQWLENDRRRILTNDIGGLQQL